MPVGLNFIFYFLRKETTQLTLTNLGNFNLAINIEVTFQLREKFCFYEVGWECRPTCCMFWWCCGYIFTFWFLK